jgi:PAS domain S-box-containing protein
MRRIIEFLLISFLGCASVFCGEPEAGPARVVVVGEESPPFEFLGTDGKPRGIVVDIWRLWGRKAGVEVDYRIMEWSAALELVQGGKADIVSGMFRTPARERTWDFSRPYYRFSTSIFFHRDLGGVSAVQDLKGFRVGIMKGDASEDLLRREAPDATLVSYPSWEALIDAALASEVRVFIADEPQTLHYLTKKAPGHLIRQAAHPVRIGELCAGVKKGNARLLALINRGFGGIKEAEVASITTHWTGRDANPPAGIPWRTLGVAAGIFLACLVVIHLLLLKRQVRTRTRELEQSKARFANIVEASPMGIHMYRLEPDGRIVLTDFNSACERILGVDCRDLLGLTLEEAFPAVRGTPVPENLRHVAETGEIWHTEALEYDDGRIRGVFDFVAFQSAADSIVVMSSEVSERADARRALQDSRDLLASAVEERTRELREANESLRRENLEREALHEELAANAERLRRIIEGMPVLMLALDDERRIVAWNRECERIIGYSSDEIVGRQDWPELLFPDSVYRARLMGEWNLRRNNYRNMELHVTTRGGGTRVLSWSNISADLPVEGWTAWGVGVDITERKNSEEALVRSERLAAVGTLAGGVAHEFNNINTAVFGFTELVLAELPADTPVRPYLERIRKAALRATSITGNLLTFSSQEDGVLDSGNLAEVARESLLLIQDKLRSDGIEIQLELDDVPDTLMDRAQVGQVILNLLINAQHALMGRPERKIVLEAGTEADTVWLTVRDTGCGIAPAEINKIFMPFFSTKGEHARGCGPQADVRGTGLGLSISHTIARNHGGELQVESRIGEGSAFRLCLPLRATPPREEKVASSGGGTMLYGRVLVLDDEKDVRDFVAGCLRRNGCAVKTSGDGEEALRWLAEEYEPFDVALVDLQMPGMPGREFLEEMARTLPENRQPVCIVFTGLGSRPEVDACGEFATGGILRKPIGIAELLESVRTALNARRGKASETAVKDSEQPGAWTG